MKRREFTKMAGLGALALHALPAFPSAGTVKDVKSGIAKVPLGLCDHSLRGMRMKARQIIEYAIEQNLDSVLFNSLSTFESLDAGHLLGLKNLAGSNDIIIYVGAGSICERSKRFSDKYGNADSTLKEGIRVAAALGSPIVGCRIGTLEDRYTEGGIKPKTEEVIRVMKANRSQALDAGIKFAFENHAGDLRSQELLNLILETGTDICGALYDPGNAIWAMEDPIKAQEVLGEHIICTSVRDFMVWGSEEGATFQWTAIGEGLMDYQRYTNFMAENCPGIPLHVETISNDPRPIPFMDPGFWKGFPELPASELLDFLKLLRIGKPIEIEVPGEGIDKRDFDIDHQQTELKSSLGYLRTKCNAGIKK